VTFNCKKRYKYKARPKGLPDQTGDPGTDQTLSNTSSRVLFMPSDMEVLSGAKGGETNPLEVKFHRCLA
jgi:hypothetical protein